jgi:hypothetical protein
MLCFGRHGLLDPPPPARVLELVGVPYAVLNQFFYSFGEGLYCFFPLLRRSGGEELAGEVWPEFTYQCALFFGVIGSGFVHVFQFAEVRGGAHQTCVEK